MSKSSLLFVFVVVISSTIVVESRLDITLENVFENENGDSSQAQAGPGTNIDSRIVGGTEADPGEYPYFGKSSEHISFFIWSC